MNKPVMTIVIITGFIVGWKLADHLDKRKETQK